LKPCIILNQKGQERKKLVCPSAIPSGNAFALLSILDL
jgi:hypothetical protein